MLPEKVFVQQVPRYRLALRIHGERLQGRERHFLEHNRMISRFSGGFTPRKWRMSRDEYSRHVHWINSVEPPKDGVPDVGFILALDFGGRQMFGYRNRAVEVIGVRRAEARNLLASLRPDRGVARMCMNDSADFRERAVQDQVRCQVG